MNPYDVLLGYPDRTKPLITSYSGVAGRVELSVAGVANAVAKAASMLRDGLGAQPGCLVSVDLPRHWQLPVWTLAALSVGARCGRRLDEAVEVRVLGPDGLAALMAGGGAAADEVLVSSCDALGMPVPGGVPAGVLDIGTEVRGYPDRFVPDPDAELSAALVVSGRVLLWVDLAQQASGSAASVSGSGVPPGARLWLDESSPDRDLLLTAVVAPLLSSASLVIGTGLTPSEAAAAQAAEEVTGRVP